MSIQLEALSAAEIKIQEIFEANNAECAALRDQIAQTREALTEAEAAMKAAEEATDAAGYVQASREQHVHSVALEMLGRKLEKLETGALVSQDEFTAMRQEIRAEEKAAEREEQEKIVALLGEIDDILTDIQAARRRAENAGNEWTYAHTRSHMGPPPRWGSGLFNMEVVKDDLTQAKKHLNIQKGGN